MLSPALPPARLGEEGEEGSRRQRLIVREVVFGEKHETDGKANEEGLV